MKKIIKLKKNDISLSGEIIVIITTFTLLCSIFCTSIMFVNMTENAKDIVLNNEKICMEAFRKNINSMQQSYSPATFKRIFENYFETSEDEYNCFIYNDGNLYCSDSQKEILSTNKEKLLKYIQESSDNSVISTFNHQRCVISTAEISYLNGTFVHIKGIKSTVDSFYQSQIPYILVMLISMLIFIIIIFFLIRNIFKRFNTLTLEVNTRRQLLVKNAEIKSLQNQINAHFMYNVLETIKMMAEIKGEFDISDAITSLGQMFRYSMKWTSGMVELKEEIHYIRNYLNLLNLRFDYEIYLSLNIPEEYMSLRIPKMSLQPLVENSVYHGIENVAKDTSIYIKAFEKNGIVNIEVSDAGVGMSKEALNELCKRINDSNLTDETQEHGRALYNVSERLKMYFGPEYGLQIFSKEGMYTKVLIQIPLDKENDI